jgi:hypothetical protein
VVESDVSEKVAGCVFRVNGVRSRLTLELRGPGFSSLTSLFHLPGNNVVTLKMDLVLSTETLVSATILHGVKI